MVDFLAVIKMIRLATHKDTKIIVGLLKEFLKETSYKQSLAASENLEHLCKLTWTCQQHGYIWLAFVDEQPVGLLISVKEPNMWAPNVHELRELVWYVLPEHRTAAIGGKLFLTFCKKAEALLDGGQIDVYFTTRMTTTDDYNLQRRGFRLVEQTYIKER